MPSLRERVLARLRLTHDKRSYRELMRLRGERAGGGGASGEQVDIRILELGDRAIRVRAGTADVDAVWDTFVRRTHLPPARVQRHGMHMVWHIGAKTGLRMADMAQRWPEARVLGVEPDADLAALARHNFDPWGDRGELIEGEIALDALLERSGGGPVAFVLIDAGGAERELLTTDTGWASQVAAIKVELHGDYTHEEAIADLEQLGFEARRDRRYERAVIGTR